MPHQNSSMASSPTPIDPHPSSSSKPRRASRQWSDLGVDLLLCIFPRLSSLDLLLAVSAVCSPWRAAARHPQCWRSVNLSDWDSVSVRVCARVYIPLDKVVSRVLGFMRESELIEEVHFPLIARENDLLFLSQRLPNLRYFSYPSSKEPGTIFRAPLANFKSLKGIAVHTLYGIIGLLRWHFPDFSELKLLGEDYFDSRKAKVICKLLPKLRKLEMPSSFGTDTDAVLIFLSSLEHLEYFDISGCISSIDKKQIENASRFKDVYLVFPKAN
ncbi:hypothetical protein LUZ60_000726 [Juncus effusus]|nr:hypothetical protein LUZ60_000726 [Juncus effusus]